MRILRIISVLCCLFLVASPVIMHMHLQVRTLIVKNRMHERLEKENLVTLNLDHSQLHWYKEGKELLIGEELFDVKNITETSYGYIVKGLFDKKEKELKKSLEGLGSKTRQEREKNLISFLQLAYYPPLSIQTGKQVLYPLTKHYPLYSEDIIDNAYPVIVPPPKAPFVS